MDAIADGVLAVFAHPDDESLSAGGLLAARAADGTRTAVLTPTWAENTRRAAELTEALRILGAGEPRMLGYADARAAESAPGRQRWCEVPLEEAVRRVVAEIRDFRPDVVVTHDAYGGVTGHPDHVQTHRVTRLAVEAAGRGDLYPEAGEPWRDAALHLATHPRSALPMLEAMIGTRKARHVVPDEDVTVSLDVSAWLEQKVAAIMAHRTEVERGALPALVSGLTLEHRTSLLGTEWYSSVACATGQWVGLDPR